MHDRVARCCPAAVRFSAGSSGRGINGPLQTLTWKQWHLTMGAFAGYWLDRTAFQDRVRGDTLPLAMIRRAIVMSAAMYTPCTGL